MRFIAKKILECFSFKEAKYLNLALSAMPGKDSITLVDVGAAGDIEPRWKKIEQHLEYFGFEPDARSLQRLEAKPSQVKNRKLFSTELSTKPSANTNCFRCIR